MLAFNCNNIVGKLINDRSDLTNSLQKGSNGPVDGRWAAHADVHFRRFSIYLRQKITIGLG